MDEYINIAVKSVVGFCPYLEYNKKCDKKSLIKVSELRSDNHINGLDTVC